MGLRLLGYLGRHVCEDKKREVAIDPQCIDTSGTIMSHLNARSEKS
jgi:hypothetical protein